MRMIFRLLAQDFVTSNKIHAISYLKVDHGWLNQREHLISYTVITRKKSDCLASSLTVGEKVC